MCCAIMHWPNSIRMAVLPTGTPVHFGAAAYLFPLNMGPKMSWMPPLKCPFAACKRRLAARILIKI
jgi:hypothetical protein